jgi:hypothetical protein
MALERLNESDALVAITCHTFLEILGVLSFNHSASSLVNLAAGLPTHYRLHVIPVPAQNPDYAGLSFDEVRGAVLRRLSVGDAITFLQIERFIPQAACFLTWNARHFAGKLSIPAITPEDWIHQQTTSP